MSNKGTIFCRTPIIPSRKVPPGTSKDMVRLVYAFRKMWVPGTVITYCFLNQPSTLAGSEPEKKLARDGFDEWQKLGISVKFEEVTDPSKAMARIGFKRGHGYWSFVGTEILNTHFNCHSCGSEGFPSEDNPPKCPNCGSEDLEVEPRTMNLDRTLTIDPRGKYVASHEMGHTLALEHEHQSPFGGIEWNVQAVYDEFKKPPNNWPPEMVDWNILRKLDENEVKGSEWDPDSIMEYEFGPGLILKPEQYKAGITPAGGISPLDQKWITSMYPPPQGEDEIKLNEPVVLKLKPGKAKEFSFIAPETRAYDFQTFGDSHSVIVLFEEINGKRKQLKAVDDSLEKWNAHIRRDLKKGNKYILSIRLFKTKGETTLKVW